MLSTHVQAKGRETSKAGREGWRPHGQVMDNGIHIARGCSVQVTGFCAWLLWLRIGSVGAKLWCW